MSLINKGEQFRYGGESFNEYFKKWDSDRKGVLK